MNNDYAKQMRQQFIAGAAKTFRPQADRNEARLEAAKSALGDKYALAPANRVRRITPHSILRLVTRTSSVAFVA